MSEINKYPVGKFERPEIFDTGSIKPLVDEMENFVPTLENTLKKLSQDQLAARTLPGIWTIAQVVNHLADSHMNGLTRVKLALTEDNPTIKPYKDALWANVVDATSTDLSPSLDILRGVHKRMALIFRSLDNEGLKKTYFHPETKATFQLGQAIALYAWHGRHHLSFIDELLKAKGW